MEEDGAGLIRQKSLTQANRTTSGLPCILMNYRLFYVGAGLLVVAVILLAVVLVPRGEQNSLPSPIESIAPMDNSSVPRQTELVVDLLFGYQATIRVNGYQIPNRELRFVEATGVYRWRPSSASVIFPEWRNGNHTIGVDWSPLGSNRDQQVAEFGSYQWSFRVQ